MTDESETPDAEPAEDVVEQRDILAVPMLEMTPAERDTMLEVAALNKLARDKLTADVDDIAARMLRVEDCIKDLITDLGVYSQSPLSDDAVLSELLTTAHGRWLGEIVTPWQRIVSMVEPVFATPDPQGNDDDTLGGGNSDGNTDAPEPEPDPT